jgi:ABC-type sugar transport system permease subunit
MQPKEVQANQLRHHWEIYFFIVPTLILIGLFQYYPASSGIFHSLFRWNGSDISEFVGFENYVDLLKNLEFWNSFKLAFILGFWNVIKMIPALLVAVCIHRCTSEKMQFFYRTLFVVPMVIPGLITVLIWRSFFFEATAGYLNQFLAWTGLMALLQHGGTYVSAKLADPNLGGLAKAFLESFDWLTAFKAGTAPAWLGDPKIIIIACVVWGFPWVGSFAVLTHLAKLQNISKDVYEAADIDGATWWSRFTKIELPLLMGSIYLLLVFAIIDTIKDAGMILALAGIAGGPGGKATVPALFMLRKAFMDQQMGYACAVGIVLTVVVLLLQKICNMLLQPEPEGGVKPDKTAWFGILALYAFAEAYLFFKGVLLPKAATPAIFAAFVGGLVLKLAVLVTVPVALRKFGAALRGGLALVAAALIAAAIFGPASVAWLLFGFALLMMLATSLFKAAIGAAGAVLIGYGVSGDSLNMIISGAIFMILATPWGKMAARLDKAYLARCMKRPTPPVSQGDLYVARSFARQQQPVYKAAAVAATGACASPSTPSSGSCWPSPSCRST